jgi:transaldolase
MFNNVKIFADGADLDGIKALTENQLIQGFTTNPTLMKAAGITDYEGFSKEVIELISGKPISLEVFSDEFEDMKRQATKLSALGENVYVKIPITNTRGESSQPLIKELSLQGIKLNVTALMTLKQVEETTESFADHATGCISVFAGRIADTGVDPVPLMEASLQAMSINSNLELIWASPREILNVVQADDIGCHIITVTHDLLKKLSIIGKNLDEYSLDTVKMFFNDAKNAGFTF